MWIIDPYILEKNKEDFPNKEPLDEVVNKLNIDCPPILYGSYKFLRNNKNCYTYCNITNLSVSTFMNYYPLEYFFNKDFIWIPWGLINKFPIYARPDSVTKIFSGQVINDSIDYLGLDKCSSVLKNTICCICEPKKLPDYEIRYLIGNRKIIDKSTYLKNGIPYYEPYDYDDSLVLSILKMNWQPDLIYTIDIAISNGLAYIMEFNSFSCAGLYNMDYYKVVKEVSELAKREMLGEEFN